MNARAGDALLHPLAIAAIALLVLNDHLFKAAFPGVVTGKLSDFAGLAFFPLVIVTASELVLERQGRFVDPSVRTLQVACVATAAAFALAETTTFGAMAFEWGLGLAQWPVRGLFGLPLAPVASTSDLWDLLALPTVFVAWRIGARRVPATWTVAATTIC